MSSAGDREPTVMTHLVSGPTQKPFLWRQRGVKEGPELGRLAVGCHRALGSLGFGLEHLGVSLADPLARDFLGSWLTRAVTSPGQRSKTLTVSRILTTTTTPAALSPGQPRPGYWCPRATTSGKSPKDRELQKGDRLATDFIWSPAPRGLRRL